MDEVINVGMNKINKTPEAVKATANSSLKGNKKSEHEKSIISCSDSFLPYVSDKTKKNGGLFVCYFFFCLSLRQI